MNQSLNSVDELLQYHRSDELLIIETMVEQYHSLLFRLALSILHNPAEAEDAVQDALIKAFLHLDRYTPGTNFKAWLASITVNVCRGYLRKQHTRNYYDSVLRTIHIISEPLADPEQSTLEKEHNSHLWSAVSHLGEKHKMVVILYILQELTVSDIAFILGTNQKTVYSRLYTAFSKLRDWLKSTQNID
jgi:RNA polymerase sigma-70 factor (ECF subfamily)